MQNQIEIYGIPMDLGVDLRGVDMGPSALRIAGLAESLSKLGHKIVDKGDLNVTSRTSLKTDDSPSRYIHQIAEVCEKLFQTAFVAKQKQKTPIFIGGDHSIAMGTVAGVSHYFRQQKKDISVFWFDAHADMNTPDSSPSGNVHGMPLAALLGDGAKEFLYITKRGELKAENIHLIGIRDLDSKEREYLSNSGINVYSMQEIDTLGMAKVTQKALGTAKKNTAGIHLSFDIDGLDPDFAPGVSTPVRGGVTFREAHLFMEMIAESKSLVAMDMVELNPIRDSKNTTAEAVAYLIESAFGRTIMENRN